VAYFLGFAKYSEAGYQSDHILVVYLWNNHYLLLDGGHRFCISWILDKKLKQVKLTATIFCSGL
jgi:hypothetical protein